MKKYFTREDIDGFFGLFIDNLLQLMVIYELCTFVLKFPNDLLLGKILPGCALSILVGNLFYSYQARKLMEKSGRDDVTALPYGINTPSVFAFIFFVMAPVYFQTNDTDLAWKAGLFACFTSGCMEVIGSFIGNSLRKHTPRAALLSPLAGIAITFICMGFVFRIFQNPVIALIPMFLIIISYASRIKLPLNLPGGFVAVFVGLAITWASSAMGYGLFTPKDLPVEFKIYTPQWSGGDIYSIILSSEFWGYMAIIFPMGLFNVIGSLQNLESAEAAGDSFETKPSLLADGLGTVTAALFGSPFPTTIYIGHPGWKNMGARSSYSVINGVVISLICFVGALSMIIKYTPLETTLGIILWIGVIIMAQSHSEIPKKHHIAMAIGLIPCLAAWAFLLIEGTASVASKNLLEIAEQLKNRDIYIHGIIALNQGFIITSMIYAAVTVQIVDRKFKNAAYWLVAAALLSFTGVIHGFALTEKGLDTLIGFNIATDFAILYVITALLVWGLHFYCQKTDQLNNLPE